MGYCQNCGTQHEESAAFCTECGAKIGATISAAENQPASAPKTLSEDAGRALGTLVGKMKTSSTIWTLVGIYQLVGGLVTILFGYGITMIALGIWNLVQSSRQRKNAEAFQAKPVNLVGYFENQKTTCIVFIFVNFILGGIIGAVGSIYDFMTCNYVLTHKDAFNELDRRAQVRV